MKEKIAFYSVIVLLFISLHAKSQQTENPVARSSSGIYDAKYPFHPETAVSFTSSNLPIVIIDLDERMKDKQEDTRVKADMKIIWHRDGSRNYMSDVQDPEKLQNSAIVDYNGFIGIKYRGNSSYNMADKKPFGMQTWNASLKKNKISILGMGADSDWALLSSYADKSLMRDIFTFDILKGYLDYVPTGRYCEVVLNGIYQGVYIMVARVRTGDNRINIPSPKTSGDELTGGYHLEIDRSDEPGFYSNQYNVDLYGNQKNNRTYYQYKSPDGDDYAGGTMEVQRAYIINYIHEFERVMAGADYKNPQTGYRKYLDVTSVIDFMLAQELARNNDAYRLSTPLYKDRDSVEPRFKMSIWDLNLGYGNANYYEAWPTEGWCYNFNRIEESNLVPFWFKKLLEDDDFQKELKARWSYYRTNSLTNENIVHKIDSLKNLLSESQARNFSAWKILGRSVWPNYFVGQTWQEEIDYFQSFVLDRVAWIDGQWLTAWPDNLLANAGFEKDPYGGLSMWTTSGDCGTSTNAHSGNKSMSFRGSSKIRQTLTELKEGIYTLEFWARTEGTPKGSYYLLHNNTKYFAGTVSDNQGTYTLMTVKRPEYYI